jgi:hypothetical protein
MRTLNLMLRCLANSLARPDEAETLAREVRVCALCAEHRARLG